MMNNDQILIVGGFGAGMAFWNSPFLALAMLAFGVFLTKK